MILEMQSVRLLKLDLTDNLREMKTDPDFDHKKFLTVNLHTLLN